MGEVRAEITLVNIEDQGVANRGFMPQEEVRRLTVSAVVDTGAMRLVINEELREKLGLKVEETSEATLAGGVKIRSQLTEPVRIYWKDRDASCKALVLPDEDEVLLGALPLEDMDVMADPTTQQLVGAHGDKVLHVVK